MVLGTPAVAQGTPAVVMLAAAQDTSAVAMLPPVRGTPAVVALTAAMLTAAWGGGATGHSSSSNGSSLFGCGAGTGSFTRLQERPLLPLFRFGADSPVFSSLRAGRSSSSSWKGQHTTLCPNYQQANHQPWSSRPLRGPPVPHPTGSGMHLLLALAPRSRA
ncbi:hypothetical protein EOD39_16272 [Acipenser ruthenus]|uniref:Uncharacterized protein n=1 Tax=Acipenser ruthenus TaxID=7906 RepID=A0A444V6D5_ACIRT|nr:hypothetical protein EOD39_16272 [Acipenser ruthenus]